jgi:hypothetical protein
VKFDIVQLAKFVSTFQFVLVVGIADRLCGLVVKSSWLQILRSRVRFPALPVFLRSTGSGTGSTQPREDN